jgi:hypothetical protein
MFPSPDLILLISKIKSGDGNMAKIIEFKLPDMLSAGYVGYETPVEREERPYNPGTIIPFRPFTDELQAGQGISFQTAKQALELAGVKREYLREQEAAAAPPKPRKRPIIVSALPGEAIPAEYDLRPLLQRDGLILLSWAAWNNHEKYGICYRVNWVASCGKSRHYASGFLSEIENMKELIHAMPSQLGDRLYRQGIAGRTLYETDLRNIPPENIADIVFFAAPDLNYATIPLFVEKLKQAGSTVDFGFEFSLGKARELEFKRQAEEIEGLKMTGAVDEL